MQIGQRSPLGALHAHRSVDGRMVLAAVVAAYLGAVALARLGFGFDVWWHLGVWTHDWAFLDAQNVTSAAECWRRGHDVLVDNPCDPLGRPLNYPRVWLALALLGMGQSWTVPMGLVLGALFLAGTWAVIGRIDARDALIVAAAVCAPAVMLGVERGQVDLAIFALLAAAVAVWRANRKWAWITGPAIVLVAAVLKLFPVAALGAYLLTRDRRAVLAAAGAGLLFVGYAALTIEDIQTIRQILPQAEHYAYGARILVDEAGWALAPEWWAALGMARRQLLAAAPLAFAATLGWLAWPRARALRALTPVTAGAHSWRRLAFHMGALTYVATFATANNWDYRLVFLLLCMPQLLEWLRAPRDRVVGLVGVSVLIVQLWFGPYMRERGVIDELWGWLLATVLVVLLIPGARATWNEWRNRSPQRAGTSR